MAMMLSVVSFPFTTLYSLAAVGLVEWINQGHFPPSMSSNDYLVGGIAAGTASLCIATFSIDWGAGSKPPDPKLKKVEANK